MQAPSTLIREVPYAVQLCLVAIVYFIAARLSLSLAIPPGYATPVWPPSGLALAAVLLLGSRVWPGIWLGAALANITVEASFLSTALIASGNTLEALAAGALIRRYVGDPGAFRRGEDVIKFILLCGLSASIAATVAALALAAGHTLDGFRNWWTWWQGDTTGMIIVAPLVLSWCARSDAAWPRQKKLEAACFGLLLALTVYAISSDAASHFAPFSLTFVSLPFILWAGLRFGQREVASAIAVVCAVAVWYTLERRELFASVPLNELLLMLLTFISMVVATGLVLAVVVAERSRVTEELRRKHERVAWQAQKQAQGDSVLHTPKVSERVAAERLSLETRLRQAIEREEFVLHYQPKIDLDTRRVSGFEALIRWRSPELGLVSPLEFIPLLEETGMILEVGSWALRRAMLDQRLWAGEGVRVPRVAVNVSPIQLRQPDFVERIREAVATASGPCMIDLEITESHLMADIESTIDKLTGVRALGIGIAIDDFGTGYSSLAYLARLPVKTLKIDRAFIVRMLDDEEAMALVQTIISLARSLKLTTVAEGVETEEQADLLELLRCDEVQGYFFSAPKPREQLAELLRSG